MSTSAATFDNAALASKMRGKPEFKPEAFSARELIDQQFAPARWVLRDLIPEGTILLAGKPKSGKSWFALDLLVSCVMKLEFLREETLKCGGLYLALEDNPRRMQKRLRTLVRRYADREDDLARLEYRCDWPPGAEGAGALDVYLVAHPNCKVVVVDVLKKIRPRADARRNAYDLDYEAIEPWKKVADKHRVTLILVHHSRKAAADDVFDEISGTLGINGVVDQMIVLRRPSSDGKKATLHMRGRDLEDDVEIAIELRDGWWEYVGEASKVAGNEARQKILDLLGQSDGPMTVPEILTATGKSSRPSLQGLLSRMVDDGQIARESEGRYTLPTTP